MAKTTEWWLTLIVIGSALAFGGVQPLATAAMEVLVLLALLLLVLAQTRRGEIDLCLPVWPLLFLLLVVFQLIWLPGGLVARLSPMRLLDPDLGGLQHVARSWRPLSIYPYQTLLALAKLLAYVAAFVLAGSLFDSRLRRSTLVRGLIALGFFEAAYGIVQYLTGWQQIFTYKKQFYIQEATGTYINHNHFAGLLGLIVPLVGSMAFYHFQRWTEGRAQGLDRQALAEKTSAGFQLLFYVFVVLVLAIGVVFSRSRGGILAMVFSLVFISLLAQLRLARKVWAAGVFIFLICLAGYALWIGLDPVLARFEQLGEPGYLQLEGRIAIWKDSLRLIRDFPLFGTGLGTFGLAFRRYQTGRLESIVDHAHSDYLEFAAETGVLGLMILLLPMLYLFGKMIVAFLNDPRRYRRAVLLGCIGSTLAILIHSVVDFNLQIPANALVFAVILGIGYKAACVERAREAQDERGRLNPGTIAPTDALRRG
jgi:O-antigen ligase